MPFRSRTGSHSVLKPLLKTVSQQLRTFWVTLHRQPNWGSDSAGKFVCLRPKKQTKMDVCQAVRVNLSIHLIPGNIAHIYTWNFRNIIWNLSFHKFLLLSFIFCHKKKKLKPDQIWAKTHCVFMYFDDFCRHIFITLKASSSTILDFNRLCRV